MRFRFMRLAAAASAALFAGSASATTILQLSDVTSDSTPAANISATIAYTVTGNDTLTLVVENQSQTPTTGYNIINLFFNASNNTSNLILTSSNGSQDGNNLAYWELVEKVPGNNGPTRADGFGVFSWALMDGVNGNASTVHPTEIQTFTLSFTCAANATCTDADFALQLSTGSTSGGNSHQYAAAHFVSGPNDDSAFGGTTTVVPEPQTAALLVLGLLGLAARRRLAR